MSGRSFATLRAARPPRGRRLPVLSAPSDRHRVGPVQSMELEHYPGMTEKAIETMIDEAHKRFDICAARSSTGWACCSRATKSCWSP